MAEDNNTAQQYWKANLRVLTNLLIVWFVVSFGFGILLADVLNYIQIAGFKLGFWFAQQGAIYVFLILIGYYVVRMNKIDRQFGVREE
jgi:putative solute:sodium symporter small subunit